MYFSWLLVRSRTSRQLLIEVFHINLMGMDLVKNVNYLKTIDNENKIGLYFLFD